MYKLINYFNTPINENYFNGYYDKSPLNKNNTKLLALKVTFISRIPNKNDFAEIGYFEIQSEKHSKRFVKVTTTYAFNWQQGCMLMWFDDDNTIIFNDYVDGKYCTKIFNIENRNCKIIEYPFYTISSKRDFFLTIDFERLFFYRKAYSYINIENILKKNNYPKNDGIYKYNISTNSYTKILSFSDIKLEKKQYYDKKNIHYIEHLMLSPDDNLVAFLYRIKFIDNELITKLCLFDLSNNSLKILNTTNRLTHFSWRNNNEIIAWAGSKTQINNFRFFLSKFTFLKKTLLLVYKFIFKSDSIEGNSKLTSILTGDSYKIFNINDFNIQEVKISELNKDGHPSFSRQLNNLLITDTYPNKYDKQNLFLVDVEKSTILDKITLNSNHILTNTPYRCDLHPKWSICGNFISIDETTANYRGITVFKIEKINE
jgi:hypothetical protein